MGAEKLYTPELLALAVSLAEFPPNANLPFHGGAKSKTCGSTLQMDLDLDSGDRIAKLGMKVHACAIGQAAAAIFAAAAIGHDLSEIESVRREIEAWLAGGAKIPEWPGFARLLPVRDYPGRHGALLLPWNAAGAALSTAPSHG